MQRRTKAEREQLRRREMILLAGEELVKKVLEGIPRVDPENFNALKTAAAVLKDAKDILTVQTDAELREQEARIAGLEKKAGTVPAGDGGLLTVSFSEETERMAQ